MTVIDKHNYVLIWLVASSVKIKSPRTVLRGFNIIPTRDYVKVLCYTLYFRSIDIQFIAQLSETNVIVLLLPFQ